MGVDKDITSEEVEEEDEGEVRDYRRGLDEDGEELESHDRNVDRADREDLETIALNEKLTEEDQLHQRRDYEEGLGCDVEQQGTMEREVNQRRVLEGGERRNINDPKGLVGATTTAGEEETISQETTHMESLLKNPTAEEGAVLLLLEEEPHTEDISMPSNDELLVVSNAKWVGEIDAAKEAIKPVKKKQTPGIKTRRSERVVVLRKGPASFK